MTRLILIILLCTTHIAFSQNPVLNIYLDTKEVNKTKVPVYAFVKSNGKYYSILKTQESKINLPEHVQLHEIEALTFIIKNDTITFTVAKLLEDLKTHPEKNAVDELYYMFKEIKKWDLRIDNFKYASKEHHLIASKVEKEKTAAGKDYKVYSLLTTSFKYYIVKV
ncbi:hypothetical protein CNR22_19000 [Sphingobacteriaceae bacterium]|nr:hypothetical protein CNR22_19000 [Sphingobacteriaceae bacterium]